MRWFHLGFKSYSNDELSALLRVRYDSVGALIEHGIVVDYHPPLVQVILYFWAKVFGDTELAFRFPSFLAGTIALLFVYRLFTMWFNKSASLMIVALLAVLQYPIFYSQIARMYSFGMLFSAMLAYSWTIFLFVDLRTNLEKRVPTWLNVVAISISAALCMYTHYFSFFFAAMVGVSGLFFIQRKNAANYILAFAVALIMFMPYVNVFMLQLARGGLGTWLETPDMLWPLRYVFKAFNSSVFIIVIVIGLSVVFYVRNAARQFLSRFQKLCLIWFFVPMFFGLAYSWAVNPIIQSSVLLFSFPFALAYSFSFTQEGSSKIVALATAMLLIAGVYSTVVQNSYYEKNEQGVFKELAEKSIEWNDRYGNEIAAKAMHVNDPFYIQYYLDRMGRNDIEFLSYDLGYPPDMRSTTKLLQDHQGRYFIMGWSSRKFPEDALRLIKEVYPIVQEEALFTNSGIMLLAKTEQRLD